MTRRSGPDPLQLATWQCASVLLDYPDHQQAARLPAVRAAVAVHPELAERFGPFLAWLDASDRQQAQADYVETFDTRRRCNLFLTYFAHGDTRKRGTALLRFKQAYLAAGVQPDPAELPDHLAVVLEFGATVDLPMPRVRGA